VKHPAAMGQPTAECWPEIWQDVGALTTQAVENGEAVYAERLLLFMGRFGYVEATYWTFS
jgi:hypothetical protein